MLVVQADALLPRDEREAFAELQQKVLKLLEMAEDDALLCMRVAKDIHVIPAAEALFDDRANVPPLRSETPYHLGVDVLIGEQRKIERLHAEIFTSQTISFFIDLATYWRAAVSPSAVICG